MEQIKKEKTKHNVICFQTVGLEWCSFECRKAKTKVISLANHNRRKIFDQLQRVAIKNKNNCEITFDTQLKTALFKVAYYSFFDKNK